MPYKDKEKQKDFQKKWIRERREKALDGKKCVKCNSTNELRLHHKEPGKKVDHKIWSWAPERFKREMAKCEWLCLPCHEKLHADEMRKD